MKKRLVISGGGTGGHVFPAIAVAERLRSLGYTDIVWIGSRAGLEKTIVRRWNIPFYHVPSGKLRRYLSLENLWDVFRFGAGIVRSIGLLRRLKPTALFSKGGFVSVPPVFAARLLGIPVVSHESDFDPGLATKLNAPASVRICVPYPESRRYFAPKLRRRVRYTGNPVRSEIFAGDAAEGRRLFGVSGTKPLLLVQGGSLGARQLNQLVADNLLAILTHWQVIHQRGRGDWPITDIPGSYQSLEFVGPEYPHLLAASSLVLSRAGAGAIWELGIQQKPALLLPLVAGSRGDQIRNARHCAAAGACVVLPPVQTGDVLVAELARLAQDPVTRQTMAAAWAKVVVRDGAERVAAVVAEVLGAP
jgi:UDP-N-acetylglucosamine--N-acetylmuramyl-(pentapeptide) pyrophosphoryl-undecaprenol N-acetylglucosamine transferase